MVLEFDKFFVTRYMGAKYKLLDFILPPITNLLQEGETFPNGWYPFSWVCAEKKK